MPEYKKVGYLTADFKMFHLKDEEMRTFHYHYHDFHKILILLNGDVTYCIEGRSYDLKKNDIVLVHAGEVHCPLRLFHCSSAAGWKGICDKRDHGRLYRG